jgi:salicylate hydroxylase
MSGPYHILIAGAGIGGLTAALALARAGHRVDLYEAAPHLGEIGAGVTLAPNAMRVYGHLGIAQAIVEAGVQPQSQQVQHWQDGRQLLAFERGPATFARYGAPYVYIHRADLHAILQHAALDTGRVQIHLGYQALDASMSDQDVALHFNQDRTAIGDLVVAADGVKSELRKLLVQDHPHFTGHIAWRALVDVTGPVLENLAQFPGIHIGPGRMVVRYPVRQSKILNLVFFARQQGWQEEGWTIKADPSDLRQTFADWCPDVTAMIAAIAPQGLHRWAIFARRPLDQWNWNGRLCLLGDAAHATTPFLGQGAAAAIEDAYVLSRALEASVSINEALIRYETARVGHCAFVQTESNANADRLQGNETELYGLAKLRNEETLGLFEYDVATIPI